MTQKSRIQEIKARQKTIKEVSGLCRECAQKHSFQKVKNMLRHNFATDNVFRYRDDELLKARKLLRKLLREDAIVELAWTSANGTTTKIAELDHAHCLNIILSLRQKEIIGDWLPSSKLVRALVNRLNECEGRVICTWGIE